MPRSSATTRPARRAGSACSRNAVANGSPQPSAVSAAASVSGEAVIPSPDALQLAGPLGVALGLAEQPDARRNEDDAHHDEWPRVMHQLAEAGPVDQAMSDGVQDIGRRRQP